MARKIEIVKPIVPVVFRRLVVIITFFLRPMSKGY
jgi:hypothetical protein